MFLQINPVLQAFIKAEWLFLACEIFHIVGFGISIGTVATVDISLLGLGFNRKSVPQLLSDTAPWTLVTLVIVVLAGLLLFLSDPLHYIYNSSFQFKMGSLVLAIIFSYTIHRKVALSREYSPRARVFTALISLALWLSVVAGGLFIAFVSQI